jgi:hypothetical protein
LGHFVRKINGPLDIEAASVIGHFSRYFEKMSIYYSQGITMSFKKLTG